MLENAELRERLILKDMHIGELKEVCTKLRAAIILVIRNLYLKIKDTLEGAMVDTKHQMDRMIEKHSMDSERLRRQFQ